MLAQCLTWSWSASHQLQRKVSVCPNHHITIVMHCLVSTIHVTVLEVTLAPLPNLDCGPNIYPCWLVGVCSIYFIVFVLFLLSNSIMFTLTVISNNKHSFALIKSTKYYCNPHEPTFNVFQLYIYDNNVFGTIDKYILAFLQTSKAGRSFQYVRQYLTFIYLNKAKIILSLYISCIIQAIINPLLLENGRAAVRKYFPHVF